MKNKTEKKTARPLGLRAEVEAITYRVRPANRPDRNRACVALRDLVLAAGSRDAAIGRRRRVVSLLDRFAGEDLADGLIASAQDLNDLARFVETVDERDALPAR